MHTIFRTLYIYARAFVFVRKALMIFIVRASRETTTRSGVKNRTVANEYGWPALLTNCFPTCCCPRWFPWRPGILSAGSRARSFCCAPSPRSGCRRPAGWLADVRTCRPAPERRRTRSPRRSDQSCDTKCDTPFADRICLLYACAYEATSSIESTDD